MNTQNSEQINALFAPLDAAIANLNKLLEKPKPSEYSVVQCPGFTSLYRDTDCIASFSCEKDASFVCALLNATAEEVEP